MIDPLADPLEQLARWLTGAMLAQATEGAAECMRDEGVHYAQEPEWVRRMAVRYVEGVAKALSRHALARATEYGLRSFRSTAKALGSIAKGKGNARDVESQVYAALRVPESKRDDPALKEAMHSLTLEFRAALGGARAAGAIRTARARKAGLRYVTCDDDRVRPNHFAMHRFVAHADDPVWKRVAPPGGFNCFLPGTTVSGKFVGGLRADYLGEAIEVTTQSGRVLRVTPNHPVATPHGFVKAGALKAGDQLFADVGDIHRRETNQVHKDHVPPVVEDVFRSLAERGGVLRFDPVTLDLHGDAQGALGKIDVVAPDGDLPGEIPSGFVEDGPNPEFVIPRRRDTGFYLPLLASPGPHGHGLVGISRSLAGGPGSRALALNGLAPLVLDPFPLYEFGSRAPSWFDSCPNKPTPDDASAHAMFVCDLLLASSGDVGMDDVVKVRRFDWSGHVYDLQSTKGWLLSSGIVTSNCRCRLAYVPLAELVRRGLARADGTVARYRAVPRGGGWDPGWTGGAALGALLDAPDSE